tara:strand:+ start:27 stop:824 length:798 start_codon:yes stop_codon:yes gene_type:complete
MWQYYLFLGFSINVISIPFDNGANIQGSRNAPEKILQNLKNLPINSNTIIDVNRPIRKFYSDVFFETWNCLQKKNLPIILGGDHSVVVPGIFAINEFTNRFNKEKLGILWMDAHADFNTMETSTSYNLHGMPVAILCHHTLSSLKLGFPVEPFQFGFYGVRDIDSLEFDRFQKYNMKIIDSSTEIDEWINKFDKIHISFDIDCIDPSDFDGVNTPVNKGKTIHEIKNLFKKIKKSKKLSSLDIVEYNPEKNNNVNIITEIVKELF